MDAITKKVAQKARILMLEIERDEDNNPLTLEGMIRAMILKSPDTMQYRDDALNFAYCVLGAGIDWNKQGRLADCQPNNYMNLPPDIHYGPWSKDFGLSESLLKMIKGFPKDITGRIIRDINDKNNKDLNKCIDTINDIDVRCQIYRPNRQSWYPISWYGCHLCMPVNAQEDFLHGAIETALLISQWEPEIDSNHYFSNLKTVNFVKQILPILKERIRRSSTVERVAVNH